MNPTPLDEAARIKKLEKEARRREFEAKRGDLALTQAADASKAGSAAGSCKAATRQERRELQERQRAEKEARKSGATQPPSSTRTRGKEAGEEPLQFVDSQMYLDIPSTDLTRSGAASGNLVMRLVSMDRTVRLPHTPCDSREPPPTSAPATYSNTVGLHPAIYQLGIWYRENYIIGSNARCTALLLALRAWMSSLAQLNSSAIFEYDTFVGTRKPLSLQLTHLTSMRRLSVGMGNAIRLLKQESFKLSRRGLTEAEVYRQLCEFVHIFINEKIHCFQFRDRLEKFCVPLVEEGDVLLTYAHCSIIRHLLVRCASERRCNFHVIIVDCPPLHEGRSLLEALRCYTNVEITYCYLTSMSSVMSKVTKVFLGASGVTSNGEIHSRSGTAIIAMTAKSQNLPVIIFCETYKFAHRAWLGSLTNNEHRVWKEYAGLTQYMYDLTPVRFVDVIITEYGPVPPMNIATVVREKEGDDVSVGNM